eukprot:766748-Hanusia_phi.AAC.10
MEESEIQPTRSDSVSPTITRTCVSVRPKFWPCTVTTPTVVRLSNSEADALNDTLMLLITGGAR